MKKTIKFLGIIITLGIIIFFQACNGKHQNQMGEANGEHTMMNSSQMGDTLNHKYSCPMHHNMVGMKGEKCSECGMDLEQMDHSCPMHKNVMGMNGDKCPECGMTLEEMKGEHHEMDK